MGAKVRIEGLKRAAQHNGMVGTLTRLQLSPSGERWGVRLDGTEDGGEATRTEISVRVDNLKLMQG